MATSADRYRTLTLTPLGRAVMAGRLEDVRRLLPTPVRPHVRRPGRRLPRTDASTSPAPRTPRGRPAAHELALGGIDAAELWLRPRGPRRADFARWGGGVLACPRCRDRLELMALLGHRELPTHGAESGGAAFANRHQRCHRAPVPLDHDGLAIFHEVEELRELSLGAMHADVHVVSSVHPSRPSHLRRRVGRSRVSRRRQRIFDVSDG